ncbi:MAG: serine/threonine protein kinase [Deltaproteobacteria bacterium]|nr:MAG: serine/threonine protein kinase [Deltaproteobacteria bacterium]
MATLHSPHDPPSSPAPSALLGGRWRLERPLGSGAFGTVWLARNLADRTPAAIKIFDVKFRDTGYLKELGLLFDQQHPHIVRTLDFGYSAGRKYIAYEYAAGGSLRDLLVRQHRLPARHALAILRDVVRGLRFAHERDIVHRDLKPENLLLLHTHELHPVRICDFGLAHRAAPGTTFQLDHGSPAYMAPEQFGDDCDHRVDFYALGVILYELLFGRRPFHGDQTALKHAHRQLAPGLPDSLHPALRALLETLLAKEPGDRPSSAAQLETLVDRVLATIRGERWTGAHVLPHDHALERVACWRLRLPVRPLQIASLADGQAALLLHDRVVRIGADGRPIDQAPRPHPEAVLIEGTIRSPHPLLVDRCQVLQLREGRLHLLHEGLPEGPRHLRAAPDGSTIAVATPNAVQRIPLHGQGEACSFDVSAWGTLPPVAFDHEGHLLWIATESPRTRLLALDPTGAMRADLTVPVGQPLLASLEDGGVAIAAQGRTGLQLISRQGFVLATCPTEDPVLELLAPRPGRLLALTAFHVQGIDTRQPRSLGMLDVRDLGPDVCACGDLLLARCLDDAPVLRAFALSLSTESS